MRAICTVVKEAKLYVDGSLVSEIKKGLLVFGGFCETDTKENIGAIAEYIKDMKNLQRYELLNFNPLGEGKYRSLDKENAFEKARPLSEEALADITACLDAIGIDYKIV